MDIEHAGIKELKDHLSDYVRKVVAGRVILVTDRRRVVAELRPPSVQHAEPDALQQLVQQGIVTPAAVDLAQAPPSFRALPWASVMAELSADREDRW